MKPKILRVIAVAVVALGLLASGVFFVVGETQQVVITQLGRPIGKPIMDAGLHYKIPFIQQANYFEERILKWDGSPNQIPTKDKKYIWVDTTARWRIKQPLLFMKRVGTVQTALSRLDGVIDAVVRDHVSNNMLVELVRSEGWEESRKKLLEASLKRASEQDSGAEQSAYRGIDDSVLIKGREKITREMLVDAARLVPQFGIELLDIRIKRINYVESVQQKVFSRMISERKRIAAQYRSEGEGERAAILGQMNRELAKISSEAFKTSQKIRGKADAETTRIYADAFGKDPEFFQFYRTLEYYKTFSNSRSTFVLSSDAEAFKYLKKSGDKARQ